MDVTEHRIAIESFAMRAELDGQFRFVLGRVWDKNLPIRAFLCANPSKADHIRYDLTAFKCQNLAANWGWGGFYLVNIYPNYSTLPSAVLHSKEADDINKRYLNDIFEQVDMIVIAAGNDHVTMQDQLLKNVPLEKLHCLRKNKGGGFLHPSREDPEDYPAPKLAYPEKIKKND